MTPKVWADLMLRSFLFEELPQDLSFLKSQSTCLLRAQFRQLSLQRPAFLSDAPRTSEILDHTGSRFRKVLHIDGRRDLNFTTVFRSVPPGHYNVVWRLMLQPGYIRGYSNFRAVFGRPADSKAAAKAQARARAKAKAKAAGAAAADRHEVGSSPRTQLVLPPGLGLGRLCSRHARSGAATAGGGADNARADVLDGGGVVPLEVRGEAGGPEVPLRKRRLGRWLPSCLMGVGGDAAPDEHDPVRDRDDGAAAAAAAAGVTAAEEEEEEERNATEVAMAAGAAGEVALGHEVEVQADQSAPRSPVAASLATSRPLFNLRLSSAAAQQQQDQQQQQVQHGPTQEQHLPHQPQLQQPPLAAQQQQQRAQAHAQAHPEIEVEPSGQPGESSAQVLSRAQARHSAQQPSPPQALHPPPPPPGAPVAQQRPRTQQQGPQPQQQPQQQQQQLQRAMGRLATASAKRDAALAAGGGGSRYVPRWLSPLWGSHTSCWRQLDPSGPMGHGTWRAVAMGTLTVRRRADVHLHGVMVQLRPMGAEQQRAALPPGETRWRGALVDYVELVPARPAGFLEGLAPALRPPSAVSPEGHTPEAPEVVTLPRV